MSKKHATSFCEKCDKVTAHYMSKSDCGQFDTGLCCIDCSASKLSEYLNLIESHLQKFKNGEYDKDPS